MGHTKNSNKSASQNGSVRTIMSTKGANIYKAVQISIAIRDLTSLSLRDAKKSTIDTRHVNLKRYRCSKGFYFQYISTVKDNLNNKNNSQIMFTVRFILKNPVTSRFNAETESILSF